MFKIHDDKVYFVAETPDINKVIEIFLPKDDRGTIMDSHEIRVDLCRAVIHMEKKGVRVLKVRNIEDTNKASIDIWHMPEYQEAAESPVSDVVNACIESCFDSGAMFNLPCKANRKTHEVFAVECCASPDDDDSFSYAEVKINGKDYPINFIDDILLENKSLEWWAYCDEKDDYMCGLCISSDNFHEVIPYESKSILSGLKYNRNDKVTDFHLAYLLNEGRAKNLDSNIYKKREPHVDKLEYEFNKTGDIDFYSGELYLNAIGDVVSGCDWSYKSQKKYRFGNVMNKNWLENISNSELYIAS